ncbi:MAG: BolA/IbaG family iron-sulfur metabolism protein [Pseudomonadota bacterium]
MSSSPSHPGPVQTRIEAALGAAFDLDHLEVHNESGAHNVPAGSETHFKVVLVGPPFEDQRRIARHRAVNHVLKGELEGPVHALSVHAYTLSEWQARHGDAPLSPPCHGGEARKDHG